MNSQPVSEPVSPANPHRRAWLGFAALLLLGTVFLLFGPGRSPAPARSSADRYTAAQLLFQQGLTNHLRSAEAGDRERGPLLAAAARDYQIVLKDYSDQPAWAAPAA